MPPKQASRRKQVQLRPTCEALDSRLLLARAGAATALLAGISPASIRQLSSITTQANVTAPHIVGARLVAQGSVVVGIAIQFDRPMDAAAAQDRRNYSVTEYAQKTSASDIAKFLFLAKPLDQTSHVTLKSAIYDPLTNNVTLLTTRALNTSSRYVLSFPKPPRNLNRPGLRGPIDPLKDTAGNLFYGPATRATLQLTVGALRAPGAVAGSRATPR